MWKLFRFLDKKCHHQQLASNFLKYFKPKFTPKKSGFRKCGGIDWCDIAVSSEMWKLFRFLGKKRQPGRTEAQRGWKSFLTNTPHQNPNSQIGRTLKTKKSKIKILTHQHQILKVGEHRKQKPNTTLYKFRWNALAQIKVLKTWNRAAGLFQEIGKQ